LFVAFLTDINFSTGLFGDRHSTDPLPK